MNLINLTNFQTLLRTATFRQSLITTVSIGINGVLATVFYLLVAKLLGVGDYGLFSLSVATVAVMSTIFDFGNDRGLVKFIAKYGPGSHRSNQILKTVLLTKLLTSVFFILLFSVFSTQLASIVFNQPAMARLMPATALAFASQILLFFVTFYFQAAEKFWTWGSLFVGANSQRLVLLFVFAASGRFDVITALHLFALTPFISFLFGLLFMGGKFISAKLDRSIFLELYSFNKWTFGFSAVSSLSSRLDTYMTSYFLPLSSVGIYGLATQATLFMPNLVSAMGAVTGPKFSRFKHPADNVRYLVKSSLFFTGVAVLSGSILLPLGYFFMRFSGASYLAGFVPFAILLLSQVIFLAASPIRDSILYFHSRPDFFFWASLAHGLVTLVSGFYLLPRFGLLGAGLSNLAGQFLLNLASVVMYLRLKRSR